MTEEAVGIIVLAAMFSAVLALILMVGLDLIFPDYVTVGWPMYWGCFLVAMVVQ